MRPHRTFTKPAPGSRFEIVAFWDDEAIQRFDSLRRGYEAAGLSRAAASRRAFDETKAEGKGARP